MAIRRPPMREPEAVAFLAEPGRIAVRVGEKYGYAIALVLEVDAATALRDSLTALIADVRWLPIEESEQGDVDGPDLINPGPRIRAQERGERSAIDGFTEQMRMLAEVGAGLCCYMPGAGNPEKWPTARCDCKFASHDLAVLAALGAGFPGRTSEITGCAEVRQAWRVLAMLRERSTS